MIRLQKYLADAGICSRRKAEELILEKKISVNEKIVRELGTKVDEQKDIIRYKGKIITPPGKKVYILINKPKGYVSTTKDDLNRRSVLDLIKGIKCRIFPVGRLDYNSSGLLILTNDGELTYKLTHPKHQIEKKYWIKIRGAPDESELDKLRNGIDLDGCKTLPAKVKIIDKKERWIKLEIIIQEGRNRQIRRMCEAIGCLVIKLKRISLGKINLGNLREGQWRHLSSEETEYLKRL